MTLAIGLRYRRYPYAIAAGTQPQRSPQKIAFPIRAAVLVVRGVNCGVLSLGLNEDGGQGGVPLASIQ